MSVAARCRTVFSYCQESMNLYMQAVNALPAYSYYKRRGMLLSGNTLALPETRTITRPLIIGSAIFGIGWGLSGICPGPAVVLVGNGNLQGIIFTVGMVAGIVGHAFFEKRMLRNKSSSENVL